MGESLSVSERAAISLQSAQRHRITATCYETYRGVDNGVGGCGIDSCIDGVDDARRRVGNWLKQRHQGLRVFALVWQKGRGRIVEEGAAKPDAGTHLDPTWPAD
jgi:hypothetical protein